MALRIYNTLTGKKEPFAPLRENRVGMYVCGVTVYDLCHVGHARAAIVFDTIYRYLKYRGFEVTYARNFTDIDDKIINRAQEENIPWQEVTEKYIQAFYEDMGRLNIDAPTVEPKATDHIAEMIEMISALIDKGRAYVSEGDVFYSVKSFKEYGRLSGKNIDELLSGARVEIQESKRDPLDFALWKKSKPGEPAWDSPWGAGRPGWHIECSAMSRKYLGDTFDIHGGGKDLVFPHHENEIAQSCGTTGCPPVRYWVHNGFVNINKEKMSKSLGNFFTIREIYKQFHPETLRLFLLSNHYRSPIDFSDQNLHEAEKVLTRFYEAFAAAEQLLAKRPQKEVSAQAGEIPSHPLLKKVEEAMDDDFNTAVAIAHLNEELRTLNKAVKERAKDPNGLKEIAVTLNAMKTVGQVLGLFFKSPREFESEIREIKIKALNLDVEKIETLIMERALARKAKQWDKADQCRDELSRMGIILEDTAHGTLWKIE